MDQNEGERNFHVFYQQTRGRGQNPKRWRLLTRGAKTDAQGVDDAADWDATKLSFKALRVETSVVEGMEATLRAILAVGEASFEAVEIPGQDAGSRMAGLPPDTTTLLGVAADDLAEASVKIKGPAARAQLIPGGARTPLMRSKGPNCFSEFDFRTGGGVGRAVRGGRASAQRARGGRAGARRVTQRHLRAIVRPRRVVGE